MSYLDMPWGRMAYWATAGSGLPLVFLHGAGCDSADWDAALRLLPAGIAHAGMDFRAHGESDSSVMPFTLEHLAGDVLALLERLAFDRAILVGHSLGGMVALNLAARSDRVVGLVLLEGWTTLKAANEAFREPRFYGTLDEAAIERIREKSARSREQMPPDGWEVLWESVRDFDGLPYLRTARMPIVEVYGEMGRTDAAMELLGIPENPAIRMVWISNSGHYLPHERPAEVARICCDAAARQL